MKTILSVLASALLLTYLSVQLFTLFGQSSPVILYITVFLGLVINGLFMHFQSKSEAFGSRNKRKQRTQQRGDNTKSRGNNRGTRSRPQRKQPEKSNQISTGDATNRSKGEIKWYNRRKNYGFIVEDSGEEIFFHQQEVEETPGERIQIDKGQRVDFVKTKTEKGPQAQRIHIVS